MNPEALNNDQTMNNANQIPPSKNRSDPLIFIHGQAFHSTWLIPHLILDVSQIHKFMGPISLELLFKNIKNNTLTLEARVPLMNPEALNGNQTMFNANQIPPSKNRSDPLIFIHGQAFHSTWPIPHLILDVSQIHKFMGSLSYRIPFENNQNQHIDPHEFPSQSLLEYIQFMQTLMNVLLNPS